jgi:hypothetical protein
MRAVRLPILLRTQRSRDAEQRRGKIRYEREQRRGKIRYERRGSEKYSVL